MSDNELTMSGQTNSSESDNYESEENQIETSISSTDSLEKSAEILKQIGKFLKSADFIYGEEYFNNTKDVNCKYKTAPAKLMNDCTVPSDSYNVDRTSVDREALYQTKKHEHERLDVPKSKHHANIAKNQEYYGSRKRLPDSALGFEHNLKVTDNANSTFNESTVLSEDLENGTKPFTKRRGRIKQKLKPLREDHGEHNPKFIHKKPHHDNLNIELCSDDMSENSNIDAIQNNLCDADSDSDEDLEFKLQMKLLPYYKRNYFNAKAKYLKNLNDVSENNSCLDELKGNEQKFPCEQCRNAFRQVYGPNQTVYRNVIPQPESLEEFELKLKKELKKKHMNQELMLEKQLLNNNLSSAEENSLDSDDTDDAKITNNDSSCMFLPEQLNSSKPDKELELKKKSKRKLKTYQKRIFRKSDTSHENDSLQEGDLIAINDALQYLDFIKNEPSAGQDIHCSAKSKGKSEEELKKLKSDPKPTVQREKKISQAPNTTGNSPPTNANETQATQRERDKYLELHNFYITFWGNPHRTTEDLCHVEEKLVKQIFGETIGTSEFNIPMRCGSSCSRSQLDKASRKSSAQTTDTVGNRFNRKRKYIDPTYYKTVPDKKRKLLNNTYDYHRSTQQLTAAKRQLPINSIAELFSSEEDEINSSITLKHKKSMIFNKVPLKNVRLNRKEQHRSQIEVKRKRRQSTEPELAYCAAAKKLKLSNENNFSDPTPTVQNVKKRQGRKQLSPPDKKNKLQNKLALPQKQRRKRKRKHQLDDIEFCSCSQPVIKKMKLSNDDKTTPAEYAKNKQRRIQAYSSDKDVEKKGRKNGRFQKHAQVEKAKRKRRLTDESDIPECSPAKQFKNYVNDDHVASSICPIYKKMTLKRAIKKPDEVPFSNEFDFCDCDSDSDGLPPEEISLSEEEISTDMDKQQQYSNDQKSKNKRGRPPKPSPAPRHRKPRNKAAQKYKCSQPKENKKVTVKKKNPLDDLKHCLSNSLNAFSLVSFRQRLVSNFNKELTRKIRQNKQGEKKKPQKPDVTPTTKRRDPGILRRRRADCQTSLECPSSAETIARTYDAKELQHLQAQIETMDNWHTSYFSPSESDFEYD
ncbi:uncharacterized protein LOC119689623 isoform X2 [Teleopsis dalmanni]|uniref:uncharacterized protein LOC119689623 isoform X2 n=1 Tax=Teleopsis dalmanni TaxID=139649 RepID=UPI0018CC94A4|nr:uncharacterized protein LOC119689623 isoform X2 [Teleopsis dalmanni]